jgi:hypothetical protein
MTEIWILAAFWLGLALLATLLSIWLRIATALSEIVVGTMARVFAISLFERPCAINLRMSPSRLLSISARPTSASVGIQIRSAIANP